ncbi:peroxidase superfamily protein isoform X2 [Wolffia australiana]
MAGTVQTAAAVDPSLPGKLLRLLFHDCMVEGCDGSVLVQGEGAERSSPASSTLGGFQAVEAAKRLVELFCPATVSCADILVLAARDAVEMTGGPSIGVPLGRRDGRISLSSSVLPNIIDTTFTLDEMLDHFKSKGLSLDDLVVLSGAHTLGRAHCGAFSERFDQSDDGTWRPADPSMDRAFAAGLARRCSGDDSGNVTVGIEPVTPAVFDNQYYRNLLVGRGLLGSDSQLSADPRTKKLVLSLAHDQAQFFRLWEQSFLRLAALDVKTAPKGEIRATCARPNQQ